MQENFFQILKNILVIGSIGTAGYALVKLKSYNNEKSSYDFKINQLEKEIQSLKEKLSLKTNELNELKNREIQKQRELKTYEIKINSLLSEIDEKSKELNELKETNDIILGKNIKSNKEIELLNQELSRLTDSSSYDKSRIILLENEIISLKNKSKDNSNQNDIENIKTKYETENKKLQDKIFELEKVISDLNKKLSEDNTDFIANRYKREVDKLKNELEQSKNDISVYLEEIKTLKNTINELEQKNNLLNKNLVVKNEELNNYSVLDEIAQSAVSDNEDEIIQVNTENTNIKENIFNIEHTNQVLFKGDTKNIEDTLDKVKNVENIKNYLLSWDTEEKDIFVKIIDKYQKSLEKMIKKLDLDEDDEELFEIVTDEFFSNLENTFINKLMVSIYRGIKNNNHKFYEGFIKEVNDYLRLCNVYTRNVEVNCQIKEDDYHDMEIIPKKVTDKKLHNKIEEVEMLPYYINYINDTGDIKTMTIKGKMTVCSANL